MQNPGSVTTYKLQATLFVELHGCDMNKAVNVPLMHSTNLCY